MPKTAVPLNQLVLARVKKILKSGLQPLLWEQDTKLKVEIGPIYEEPVSCRKAKRDTYKPITEGTVFSPPSKGVHHEFPWEHVWFKVRIPSPLKGEKGRRYLRWRASGEYTIYIDQKPWCGLDVAHSEAPLPDKACTLYIECGLWQTGIFPGPNPNWHSSAEGFTLKKATLSLRNKVAWSAFHDLELLIEWVEYFFKKHDIKSHTGPGLNTPFGRMPVSLRRMVKRLGDAADVFETNGLNAFEKELKRIYRELPATSDLMQASFVGHAHLDLVWRWPEKATYRKGRHTFATTLRLMEKYPEITFTMSQPPLFYDIEDHEPKQAQEIRKRIREGRWEFTGGFEVESDTQLPVGEGLVRSLIYGQKRIEAVRGEKSNTVWIPDVFGYSQCLPQIFKLGKIKYFYTCKILWSAITEFPHNSFVWKGPDGSEVLAHLALSGYSSRINVTDSIEMAENYKQSDVHNEGLLAAGYGDGGGGLTEAHCERARRLKSLSEVPSSKWSTVEGFFQGLNEVRNELPVYRGELYLEYHRGVQTTQSDLKLNFRSCERALQAHEAVRVVNGGGPLNESHWLRYIFSQFHDAIPGTSINTVNRELTQELSWITKETLSSARKDWGETRKHSICYFNPVALPQKRVVIIPPPKAVDQHLVNEKNEPIPTQTIGKGKNRFNLAMLTLAGLASTELKWQNQNTQEFSAPPNLIATPTLLKSDRVEAGFSQQGDLESLIIDGINIELESSANFMMHDDQPVQFEAWDIDHQATWLKKKATKPMTLVVESTGCLRATIKGESPIGEQSSLEVKYTLEAGSPYLHVEVNVNWKEAHQLLRYSVQTGYRGNFARYGAPFGSTDRSQKEGLPSDEAMWEVPGSRWAACLDGKGQGLAMITEAKYGFSVKDGLIGVSLLRSSQKPDPVADLGNHCIRFALGRHQDETSDTSQSTALAAETLFSSFLEMKGGQSLPSPFKFLRLGSVVPSWVLPSETVPGYIIRLHEAAGAQEQVLVQFKHDLSKIESVDFFEDRNNDGSIIERKEARLWSIQVPPYKIVSLLVRYKKEK